MLALMTRRLLGWLAIPWSWDFFDNDDVWGED